MRAPTVPRPARPRRRLGSRRAVLPFVALAAACVLASPSTATAAPRPDLRVTKGAVRTSDGWLAGSFVVRGSGAPTGRTSAALRIRVAGRDRLLQRRAVPALRRAVPRTVRIRVRVPRDLPAGLYALRACADGRGRVRERSERDNCRTVGTLRTAAPTPTPATPAPLSGPIGPLPPPLTVAPPPAEPPVPPSSFPRDPVAFEKDTVLALGPAATRYWAYVPAGYDDTHATPTELFVWLHGCGGRSQDDIATASPGGDQAYIAVAPAGREGDCWDVSADPARVERTITDVQTHFNVDPRRVVLGGYSSGGDLAYRTAFYDANRFAGILVENTSPFRDTGSTAAASLAAAAWRFPVVHLAHLQDTTYPIAGVRAETDAMIAAGFPLTRIERAGHHWDDDTATSGTDHDLRTLLLPHLDDGWMAP